MKTRTNLLLNAALILMLISVGSAAAQQPGSASSASSRPKGPCDIYAAANTPCVAAHSSTRALYASYNGPLYQVLRQSDGKTLDIGVVQPMASDPGGYANTAAQDAFCANTYCWITTLYDQSPKHNDLVQAPRGGFNGPADPRPQQRNTGRRQCPHTRSTQSIYQKISLDVSATRHVRPTV